MAALQKLADDFLTCAICQGVFQEPVTLHCGHSFCTSCLTSYIMSRPDAQAATHLPCPNCRSVTQVPNPQKPINEWVAQLKTGFFVKGLVETFVNENGPKDQTLCSLCKEEGETTPAEKWCTDCNEALCSRCLGLHKQYPKFRGHMVTDIEEGLVQKPNTEMTCGEHKDEKLKLFCVDCDIAVCQLCCSIVHRKCESVVILSDAYSQMKENLRTKVLKMQFAFRYNEQVLEEKQSNMKKLMESSDEAVLELESTYKTLTEIIDKQRDSLKKKMDGAKDRAARLLSSDIEAVVKEVQDSRKDVSEVQASIESEPGPELYNTYRRFSSFEEATTEKIHPRRVVEVNFKSNIDVLTKTLNLQRLGTVETVKEEAKDDDDKKSNGDLGGSENKRGNPLSKIGQDKANDIGQRTNSSETGLDTKKKKKKPKTKQKGSGGDQGAKMQRTESVPQLDKTMLSASFENLLIDLESDIKDTSGHEQSTHPVLIDSIETKASTDRKTPQINELITVPDRENVILVWSDAQNQKMTVCYLETREAATVEFEYPPGGITQISEKDIAVTIKSARKIFVVEVKPCLKLLKQVDTEIGYSRICAIDGNRVAASFYGSKTIDILDVNFVLIKKVTNEHLSSPMLYKTDNSGQFIVSDASIQAVFKMTTNGKTLFKYHPKGVDCLENNFGAAVDSKGNVLVVEHKSGMVHVRMIDGNEKFVKNIISLHAPGRRMCWIALDKHNRMYLSFEDSTIRVYQM